MPCIEVGRKGPSDHLGASQFRLRSQDVGTSPSDSSLPDLKGTGNVRIPSSTKSLCCRVRVSSRPSICRELTVRVALQALEEIEAELGGGRYEPLREHESLFAPRRKKRRKK
jgi:hypothetical protein